mgnify:CR=1 FL=1
MPHRTHRQETHRTGIGQNYRIDGAGMSDFSFNVTGIPQVQKMLDGLGPAVTKAVEYATANYLLKVLINDEIPPQKHVSRKEAYPKTGNGFFTNKQRRWFFWFYKESLARGLQLYQRHGKAEGGIASKWHIERKDDKSLTITNSSLGAKFLYDKNRQARQLQLVGWQTIDAIVAKRKKNFKGVMDRAAIKAIKELLKK